MSLLQTNTHYRPQGHHSHEGSALLRVYENQGQRVAVLADTMPRPSPIDTSFRWTNEITAGIRREFRDPNMKVLFLAAGLKPDKTRYVAFEPSDEYPYGDATTYDGAQVDEMCGETVDTDTFDRYGVVLCNGPRTERWQQIWNQHLEAGPWPTTVSSPALSL